MNFLAKFFQEIVKNNGDVAQEKNQPDFNKKLTQSACELLVSYLTAPYIRIPLILQFFARPEHIHALGQRTIQIVVDGALFEPALWQSPSDAEKTYDIFP